MPYEKERAFALTVLKEASALTEKLRQQPFVVQKLDTSPVTIADFCVQVLITRHLQHYFPEDSLVAEEDMTYVSPELIRTIAQETHIKELEVESLLQHGSGAGGGHGRFWTLDPIDGTRGFIEGGQYSLALALIEEGEVMVGALACPPLEQGQYFVAVRNEGAYLVTDSQEKRLKITAEPPTPFIYLEPPLSSRSHSRERAAHIVHKKFPKAIGLSLDGQCKYALIALSQYPLYIRLSPQGYEKIWDHAAGVILVEEAGGVVVDLEGKPLNFGLGRELKENRGVMASSAKLLEGI